MSSYEETMPPTPRSENHAKSYNIDVSDEEDELDLENAKSTVIGDAKRPIISRLIAGRRTSYQLSDDEICALKQEGIDPTDYMKGKVWSKVQEKVLKQIRRKIRNKKSAYESRRRKKMIMESMQAQLKEARDENANLKTRVSQLETQNGQLKSHVSKLKAFIAAASQRTAQATTCVMLLVLSLAFFLAPNYGPLAIFKQKSQAQKELQLNAYDRERNPAPPIFVSRRILQLVDDDGNPLEEPIINEPQFMSDDDDGANGNGSDGSSVSELMRIKRESLGLDEQDEVTRQTKKRDGNADSGVSSETNDIAGLGNDVISAWNSPSTSFDTGTIQLSRNLTAGLRRRYKMSDVKQQAAGFGLNSHSSLMPQEPAVYKQEMMHDSLAL